MDPRTGGPCAGIRNLFPCVSAAGHAVEVVCLDDPRSDYLSTESVRIHALGRGRGWWSYHPALRPWLEQNLPRFDAVILNGLWLYPGFVLSKLARHPNTPPYFIFPHGMLDPWFQRAPERRWKAVRNWFYWKLIEQHVVRRAAALLFTCAEEMRLARETFQPYQPRREVVVGYGINPPPEQHAGMKAAFAKKCPGLNGRPYFLFLGRIHPKKGVDLLIKAYAEVFHQKAESRKQKVEREKTEVRYQKSEVGSQRSEGARTNAETLKAEMPDTSSGLRPPFPQGGEGMAERTILRTPMVGHNSQPSTLNFQPALVIAGPGLDTPYGQEMQRLAGRCEQAEASGEHSTSNSSLNAPRSVLFPGMLTGDAKWGAIYGCEAFVLPSHQENFGIAVAEALACGRPVLISNQINIWREIAGDKAGLVEADTLEGTQKLFQKWEDLPLDDKVSMSCSARMSYQNRFSIAFAAEKLVAAMAKVTGRMGNKTTDHGTTDHKENAES
jgi:glycosyltransferase involved in cell wall biosynthesis